MSGEGGVVTLTITMTMMTHGMTMTGTHFDPGHGAGGDDGQAVHEDGEKQEADHMESVALRHAHQEGVAALGVKLRAASLHLFEAADP